MKLEYSVLSDEMAFIYNVPIDEKIDKYIIKFIQEDILFRGNVTVFKGTKYFESNGEIYQRQYEYEVERGKYRKIRYSNPLNWKIVVRT